MKKMLLTLILVPGLVIMYGQANTDMMKQQKAEAMNSLSFMLGTWEGSGYIQQGQSDRETFDVSETIQPKLNGLVYLVEGVGTVNGNTVHHALAIISWDISKSEYAFESHTVEGRSVNASGTLEGSTFTWGFETPDGSKIQYTMKFTDDTWHETGSYSQDGETWYPFMKMQLNKVNK